jgi:hypothetical protein
MVMNIDYIKIAKDYGAGLHTAGYYDKKFLEDKHQLWVVASAPKDSILGLAYFESELDAAKAYCLHRNLVYASNVNQD